MAYWQTLRGLLPPIPIRQFKGIFKPEDEGFNLNEEYATDIANLNSDAYPALKTRPGFSLLGSVFGSKILGLGVWKDNELHAIVNGQWYKWTGSTWQSLASGFNTSADWSFCNFKGNFTDINLIAANGVDPIKKYDGATVSNLLNAPAGGKYIEQHDNRLYCAVGNSIKFSALRKPEDWSSVDDAGEIVKEMANGETINGLKAGPGHLTVFFPNSIHELYGTGPKNYRLIDVANDIGTVSHKAIVNLGGVLYWLHDSGIYVYSGGVRPSKDFSAPVQKYVDGMNKAQKSKACAGTDGKNLYVAIPYGTATDPNIILEYDPSLGIWTVWEGFTPTHFAKMGNDWYIGDTAGKVMKMGGTTDNGTAIPWRWVSKPFGGGSLAQRTNWYNLWFVVDLPTGSSMNVYLSKTANGTDWTLVKSLTAQSNIQSGRVIIPVDTVANANWVRIKVEGSGPVTIYELTRQMREMPFV